MYVYIYMVYIYMVCIYIYGVCIYIYGVCIYIYMVYIYIWCVYIYGIYIYMVCIYIYCVCIYIGFKAHSFNSGVWLEISPLRVNTTSFDWVFSLLFKKKSYVYTYTYIQIQYMHIYIYVSHSLLNIYIDMVVSQNGGTPKSSKSGPWLSIETRGDLGILHFKKLHIYI